MAEAKNSFVLLGRQAAVPGLFLRGLVKPIAATGDFDDVGMMEEPVKDGAGGGNVVEQLAPFFDRPVGGHKSGANLVTAHDDFHQDLTGLGWQNFQAHVVHDEQIRLEVTGQGAIHFGRRDLRLQLADEVEDGCVEHVKAGLDGLVADGLSQVALSQPRESGPALLTFRHCSGSTTATIRSTAKRSRLSGVVIPFARRMSLCVCLTTLVVPCPHGCWTKVFAQRFAMKVSPTCRSRH